MIPNISFHSSKCAGLRRNHFICITKGNYGVCSKPLYKFIDLIPQTFSS